MNALAARLSVALIAMSLFALGVTWLAIEEAQWISTRVPSSIRWNNPEREIPYVLDFFVDVLYEARNLYVAHALSLLVVLAVIFLAYLAARKRKS